MWFPVFSAYDIPCQVKILLLLYGGGFLSSSRRTHYLRGEEGRGEGGYRAKLMKLGYSVLKITFKEKQIRFLKFLGNMTLDHPPEGLAQAPGGMNFPFEDMDLPD
jgi:hypothetical protein